MHTAELKITQKLLFCSKHSLALLAKNVSTDFELTKTQAEQLKHLLMEVFSGTPSVLDDVRLRGGLGKWIARVHSVNEKFEGIKWGTKTMKPHGAWVDED